MKVWSKSHGYRINLVVYAKTSHENSRCLVLFGVIRVNMQFFPLFLCIYIGCNVLTKHHTSRFHLHFSSPNPHIKSCFQALYIYSHKMTSVRTFSTNDMIILIQVLLAESLSGPSDCSTYPCCHAHCIYGCYNNQCCYRQWFWPGACAFFNFGFLS